MLAERPVFAGHLTEGASQAGAVANPHSLVLTPNDFLPAAGASSAIDLRPLHKWAARAMLLALLMLATFASAHAAKFRVEIAAPERLAALLRANLDVVRWSGRDDVSEDQLRQLVRTAPEQVRNLLTTEGYFSPQVQAELAGEPGERVVRIDVEPGEPTRVVAVEFRVRGAIDSDPVRDGRLARARAAFGIEEGAVFRQSAWNEGKQGAVRSLQRRLYAAARVTDSRADIDPPTREARLQVEIDSGPPFVFGEIEVTGLQRYELPIVRNFSPIRAGDPYDEDELLKYQSRLLGSGYFASAIVSPVRDPARADAAPIRVSVVESQARRIDLGAGYSTDRGPRYQAGYTDQNTLDRAWRFHTQAKVDRLSEQVVGGLTFPRRESGWYYGLEGQFNHQDIQGEELTDWSLTGARTYTVEERESQLALQYRLEEQKLPGAVEDDRKALFLSQAWTWIGLDDQLAPRDGYMFRLHVGGASRQILSDRSFGRVRAKGTYLQPVSTFGTLILRLEAGSVIAETREDLPSAYLFRTGGDTTVRGYAFESLGVEEGGAIVGGRYMAVGSIEYVQWLADNWGVAAFYDAGNAVDKWSDFRAAVGYGGGLRWRSPIGALSFDVAHGEETNEIRLHFSVGIVFR
jgi:translocation and assembly module TamA